MKRLAIAVVALVMLAACGASDNGGAVGGGGGAHAPAGPPGALHDKLPAAIATSGSQRLTPCSSSPGNGKPRRIRWSTPAAWASTPAGAGHRKTIDA